LGTDGRWYIPLMVWGRIACSALAVLLLAGCESSARIDCSALAVDPCLEHQPECVWSWPRPDGDCRNTCESDDDCGDGLACIDTRIYDGSVEAVLKLAFACSPE
jgi:hypothetical protein